MNCKPGDLALVVRKDSPNYGKLVTVRRQYKGELSPDGRPYEIPIGPAWIADSCSVSGLVLLNGDGEQVGVFPWGVFNDSSLPPIRDQDGEDQTLTWAGKPSEVTA